MPPLSSTSTIPVIQQATPAAEIADVNVAQESAEHPSAEDSAQMLESEETVSVLVPADNVAQPLTSQPIKDMPSQMDSSSDINVENLQGEESLGAVGGAPNIAEELTSVTTTMQTSESAVEVTIDTTSSNDPEVAVICEYRTSHSHHR